MQLEDVRGHIFNRCGRTLGEADKFEILVVQAVLMLGRNHHFKVVLSLNGRACHVQVDKLE